MSETLRNLQYLKTLKNQREQKMGEVRELDAQISHLRKNPTDKLTNDLLVYQYNKKKEILKQDISSIDKEIYRLNTDLENFDTSVLEPYQVDEYAQEIIELHPQQIQPEIEVEPEPVAEEPVMPTQKTSVFKRMVTGLGDIRKLIVSAFVTLSVLWVLFVCDRLNLIGLFNKYTRFKFFSFLLTCAFALTVFSVFAYKDLSRKNFGAFSDYFMLVTLVSSLGVFVFYAINQTKFKLLIAICLAVYSLIYFVFRLYFYDKTVKKVLQTKPRIFSYYYDLFSKYSLIIISLIAIISLIVLYLSMTLNMVSGWLKSTKGHKPYMIISLILVGFSFLYLSALSVIRIKERETKIIDLFALVIQIISVEFFVLTKLISTSISTIFYVLFAIILAFSAFLTIYRIIKYKNE